MSLFDVSILTTYPNYKTYVNGSGEYSFGNTVLAGNTLMLKEYLQQLKVEM